MNTLSQKQRQDVREVLAWLRGGDVTPDPEMEEKFIDTITGMVIGRMGKETPSGNYPRPFSIRAMMRELSGGETFPLPRPEAEDDLPPEDAIDDLPWEEASKEDESSKTEDGIDSVILARTLVHMGSCNGRTLNSSQIQIILYNAYGGFLASCGRRLSDEHPQMWEYGPVFPKAYNKIRKNPSDGEQESEILRSTRPEVYDFLLQCFHRYAWTSASSLAAPHTASGSPWALTRKKNPDKWGARIEDELILEWFKRRLV